MQLTLTIRSSGLFVTHSDAVDGRSTACSGGLHVCEDMTSLIPVLVFLCHLGTVKLLEVSTRKTDICALTKTSSLEVPRLTCHLNMVVGTIRHFSLSQSLSAPDIESCGRATLLVLNFSVAYVKEARVQDVSDSKVRYIPVLHYTPTKAKQQSIPPKHTQLFLKQNSKSQPIYSHTSHPTK